MDLDFIGRIRFGGVTQMLIDVGLDVDPTKYRGLTMSEICEDLRAALHRFALGVEVPNHQIERAAHRVAAAAAEQHGVVEVPSAVPEFIDEWTDS